MAELLWDAAVSGNCDKIALKNLIKAWANINGKDNNDLTPLHLAAKHNKTCTVKC